MRRAALLAAATGLALASHAAYAGNLFWDPTGSNGANQGGPGSWDATSNLWFNGSSDVAWPNTAPNADTAVFAGAAGGTVSVGSGITANALNFQAAGYVVNGGSITLSGTTPTINVDAATAGTATISSNLTGTAGLIKTGDGSLTLAGSNSFTGGTTISGGQVNFTTDVNLGTGSTNTAISLNNATMSYIGTAGGPTITKTITISGTGTLNSAANAGAGKWVLNTGGKLAGSGSMHKTGPGWLTIFAAAAAGTNFTTDVDGGVLEMGSATAVGTGSIAIHTGAEVAINTGTAPVNEMSVNTGETGIFGGDGGNRSYGGLFHVNGTLNMRLGDFFGGTSRDFTFNGSSQIDGAGTINLINSLSNNPTGQLLTIAGNMPFFTGTLNVDGGHGLLISKGIAATSPFVGFLTASATATALPAIGTGVDEDLPGFWLTDNTGSFGGVYAINSNYTRTINESSLFNGNWSLGANTGGTGTYTSSTMGAASGNLYRLGGGNGTLVIANANVVTGANDVNIGTSMINGGGTVKYLAAQNYTGATNINNGTLALFANNALPSGTITMGGVNVQGSGTTAVTTKYSGAIDVGGFTQTVTRPINIATGADPLTQTITNNGAQTGTIVFDTTAGSTVWAGQFKDGAKPLAVGVLGPNSVSITHGSASFTGGASINTGSLIVGTGNGAKMGGPVTFSNGGKLVLNSTQDMTLGVMSGSGQLIHSGTGNVTLGANNSAFSGPIIVNGGGKVTAGLSTPGVLPLSTSPITLAGGKLAVQGQMQFSGGPQPLAPVTTLTGWNLDTIYAATDTAFYPNNKDKVTATGNATTDANNSLADQFYSYFQTGFTPNSTQAGNGQLNKGTTLTNGLPGQSFTSAITNTVTGTNTPFQFQSLTAAQTLQVLGGSNGFHQGTLTLSTPSGFKSLAILSSNAFGTNDAANVTINFTDGTSAVAQYHPYDWSLGTNAAAIADNVFNGSLINRYSPYQTVGAGNGTGGWDTRPFGMFESDIDLTNINGVDYSGKVVNSLTFDALNSLTGNNQRTNIFAVSGEAIPLTSNATQTYANSVTVTADSGIDVTGSLNAVFGPLSIGAKLSVTSADATTNPYTLGFGTTTLTGAAAFDVANSTGGGAGTVVLGPVTGTGSITKSGVGTLRMSGGGNVSGGLAINGGNVQIGADATLGSLAGDGTGSLSITAGNTQIGVHPGGAIAAKLAGLSVAAGSKLDITNNALAIDYTGTTVLPAVQALIKSGYNNGSWNGVGINSSSAAAGINGHAGAVGYAEASDVFGVNGGTFAGQSVDGTTVLARFTYAGDSNLDGGVDLTDFTFLAANFNKTGNATWVQGDYNYDGNVDLTDFTFLAANFNQHLPADGTPGAGLGSLVPEPTSLAVLGLAAAALTGRRRRRRM